MEDAEEALRPLREFGPPALDMVRADARTWPYSSSSTPTTRPGMRHYWTGDFLTGLPDEAIDVLCRFHLSKPSPGTEILLLPDGGAGARVPDGTMAIGAARRAVQHPHHLAVGGPGRRRGQHRWTRELSAALKPFTTGRVYVNFIGDEGEERVVASFGADGYARLQTLKDRYDPGNLFRTSQNVRPSA